jgi:hypothetical protein
VARRKLASSNISMVNFGLRSRKFQFQIDPESLGKFGLLVDRLERVDLKLGKLADVVLKAGLRDRDCDVVGEPLLHRLDDDRRRWVGPCTGDADAFRFKLRAKYVEQVARPEYFQRLRSFRAHLGHEPQSAANHLFGQELGFGCERSQAEHDGDIAFGIGNRLRTQARKLVGPSTPPAFTIRTAQICGRQPGIRASPRPDMFR